MISLICINDTICVNIYVTGKTFGFFIKLISLEFDFININDKIIDPKDTNIKLNKLIQG